MSFFEDERIRHKNSPYYEAYFLFFSLKQKNWTNQQISEYALSLMKEDDKKPVMNQLINFCESINTEKY